MLFKRYYFKYFLPRISTTFRYKLSRPTTLTHSQHHYSQKRVSVFSPFMSFSLGLIGSTYAAKTALQDNDVNRSLADVYEECSKSVVHLRMEVKTDDELDGKKIMVSNGSGFILRKDGLILTNAHVVYDMSIKSKLKIRYHDGKVVKGQVVCIDSLSDLAIVKPLEDPVNLESYPPVNFRSKTPRVGDRVFAIGSPFGLLNTMSAGIVSGLDRSCQDLSTFTVDSRVSYLQTDLHLFPGNSGGPIFDINSDVVGISTVRSEADGLSFAIQLDQNVQRIIEQMIAAGKVRRAWLGFRGVSLNPEIVEQIDNVSKQTELNSIKHGVLVLKAYENSPAVQANLMPGDVIVAINEQPIKDIGGLLAVLDDYPIDRPSELNVKRIILANGGAKIISLKCKIKPDEYDIFTHKDSPYNWILYVILINHMHVHMCIDKYFIINNK